MSKDKTNGAVNRFEMIASLLDDDFSSAEKRKIRESIIKKHGISERTLRRYVKIYKEGGFEALIKKTRSDAGKERAISEKAVERAVKLRKELPSRSVRSIIRVLEIEGVAAKNSISVSTLTKVLDRHKCSAKVLRSVGEATSAGRFVRVGRNKLWQSDVKYGPYIFDGNKFRQTYLLTFIDDCTRLVTHSQFYFNHSTPILEDCFRKALIKYGKPDIVYVDNGSEYTSTVFRTACARLGIKLVHATPFHAAAKGKVEKFQHTVEAFINEVQRDKPASIDELNYLYNAWLQIEYLNKPHSGINNITPVEAFKADKKPLHSVKKESCDEAFLHDEIRKVNKAGCFKLYGIEYEAGKDLIGCKIDIRFDPFDTGVIQVWHRGKFYGNAKLLKIGEFVNKSSKDNDAEAAKRDDRDNVEVKSKVSENSFLNAWIKAKEERTANDDYVPADFGYTPKQKVVKTPKQPSTGIIDFNKESNKDDRETL
jgi:transposase InsO family protein